MIREEHFTFTSSQGEVMCHGMRWTPEGEVKAVLQLVHGMSEHIERYRGFAEYMASQGILVVGHDHLGHGGSVRSQEDFGYFAEEKGNRAMIRDIHHVYKITRKAHEGVPYVLLGHSMGSFLVRQYLCCFGDGLDGAVLCGTGWKSEATVKAGLAICQAEAAAKGWGYRSKVMRYMSFGSYNEKFRPNRTDSDWLCRDEEVVDAYIADGRCGFPFTLNGYYNMLLGMYKILQKEYLERMPKKLPVIFIAGEEDPVGDFGKGVRRAEQCFRDYGMENVECRLYPNDRHELLNELDRYAVYEDLLDWMKRNRLMEMEK